MEDFGKNIVQFNANFFTKLKDYQTFFDEFKKAIIDGLREGGLAVTYDRKCKLYRVESSGILVGAIE